MFIGYARVSALDQSLDLQLAALKQNHCDQIYTDRISGSVAERKGLLDEAMSFVRAGDVLVVWKRDRLGRSLVHLIETVSALSKRGIGFKSLTENIDTTTNSGKLVFHIFGALAEFERDLIRERTHAELEAARARGRRGCRPKVLNPKKIEMLRILHADKTNSIDDIQSVLNVSRSAIYRYLRSAPKPI